LKITAQEYLVVIHLVYFGRDYRKWRGRQELCENGSP